MFHSFIKAPAVLCGLLIGLGITSAAAEELRASFQSNHPNSVMLEFYSQDRNAAWPGDGQAYVIDDWETHSYALSCQSGENICYGAWVEGDPDTYWGVGMDDAYGCDDCCTTCDGSTLQTIVLDP